MFVFSMIWQVSCCPSSSTRAQLTPRSQFRFYPYIGPPFGKLSHLAMFRLGLLLYLPVYIL